MRRLPSVWIRSTVAVCLCFFSLHILEAWISGFSNIFEPFSGMEEKKLAELLSPSTFNHTELSVQIDGLFFPFCSLNAVDPECR